MSRQTWLDEFYPESAEDVVARVADAPETERNVVLVEHSLRKWKGLREENAKKHDVVHALPIVVNSDTCSLCQRYHRCIRCPLALSRDGTSCDRKTPEESNAGEASPWGALFDDNPEPMIAALEKALEFVKSKVDPKPAPGGGQDGEA